MTVVLAANSGTVTVRPHAFGDRWFINGKVTLSSTYKTGGDSSLLTEIEKTLKQVGANVIDYIHITGASGYNLQYNYETGKLQVFGSSKTDKEAGVEIAEAEYPAALRNAVLRLMCIGV